MARVPFNGAISGPLCLQESPRSYPVGGSYLSEWDSPELRFLWGIRKWTPSWWELLSWAGSWALVFELHRVVI